MQWYLVKYRDFGFYLEGCNQYNRRIMTDYLGLFGDVWPVTGFDDYKGKYPKIVKCYKAIEKDMMYIELKPNSYIQVATDLALITEYCKLLEEVSSEKVVILSISNDLERISDGFDFGNPEGGYSIIASNILEDKALRATYLNENGLFRSVTLFKEFIKTIDKSKTESLDNYYLLSIKVINK